MTRATPARRQHGGIAKKLLVFLILGALAAGGWHYWKTQQRIAAEAPPQVLAEPVRKGNIRYVINASGKLTAKRKVDVGAQVSGEIDELYVNIGDELQEGDPVANIDARSQQNSKDTAQAQLQSREAALSSAKAALREAEQKHQRQKNLVNKGAAAKETLEAAQAALKNAQSAVEQAQAAVRQSQIDVDTAGLNLGYTNVTAPFAGTVIAVPVEKGQTVNAIQSAPTLITLADLSTMTVKAEIAEADVAKVKAGMPTSFTLLGDSRTRFDGKLQSVDPAPLAVSDNNLTSTETAVYYYGHIDVSNPERRLRIGMTANIEIVVDEVRDVLVIPMTALQEEGDGDSVLVLDDKGFPQPRQITLGLQDGVNTEVKEGLREGEKVVVSQAGKNSAADPFAGEPGMF